MHEKGKYVYERLTEMAASRTQPAVAKASLAGQDVFVEPVVSADQLSVNQVGADNQDFLSFGGIDNLSDSEWADNLAAPVWSTVVNNVSGTGGVIMLTDLESCQRASIAFIAWSSSRKEARIVGKVEHWQLGGSNSA